MLYWVRHYLGYLLIWLFPCQTNNDFLSCYFQIPDNHRNADDQLADSNHEVSTTETPAPLIYSCFYLQWNLQKYNRNASKITKEYQQLSLIFFYSDTFMEVRKNANRNWKYSKCYYQVTEHWTKNHLLFFSSWKKIT